MIDDCGILETDYLSNVSSFQAKCFKSLVKHDEFKT